MKQIAIALLVNVSDELAEDDSVVLFSDKITLRQGTTRRLSEVRVRKWEIHPDPTVLFPRKGRDTD